MQQFEKICRLCLNFEGKVYLFDDDPLQPYEKLATRFTMCTQVQISVEDLLPKSVCEECANRINDAFKLKELAQNSDRELKKQINYNLKSTENVSIEACEEQEISHLSNIPQNIEKLESEDPEEFLSEIIQDTLLTEENILLLLKSNKSEKKYNLKKIKRKKLEAIQNNVTEDVNKEELSNEECHIDGNDSSEDNSDVLCDKKNSDVNDIVSFQCNTCHITFKYKTQMLHHMRRVHQLKGFGRAKDFMCDTCGKTYFDQHGLQLHKRSHTGYRPYKCDICGQGFSQLNNMNRHISAKHKKDKPYKCDVCSKNFAYMGTLKQHKRQHYETQIKHHCSICERKFNRIFSLRRHQLTHTQAKPYICKHCKRPYSQSNDLKSHVKKTHPEQSTERFSDYCVKQDLEVS